MTSGLPDGFRVRIRDDIRVADSGRTLVGGAPMHAVRLTDRAAGLVVDGEIVVRDQAGRVLAERLLEIDLAVPVLPPDGSSAADELTVVIPVRDRVRELERVLGMLRPALRCIVVDDGSRDPAAVADVVRRSGAESVVLPVNLGPAAARNAGLRRVGTPLVAFVDSDVTAAPEVLLRLGSHFADPRLAVVAPRISGHADAVRPRWFQRYDAVASPLDLGRRPSGVRPGAAVAWLPSACLVARTTALTAALPGGFDESMRVGEDVDLVWRLTGSGWRVRYDPELEVRHQSRPTVATWLARIHAYGTGGGPLAARHGDLVAPAVLTPAYAVAAVALLAQRRWSAAVVLGAIARSAVAVHRALPDTPARPLLAAQLAGQGIGWTGRQVAALLLRHWWPATAVAAILSRRIRRAVLVAVAADLVTYLPHRARVGPVEYLAARRLDDLAYGAGLWTGALRARSTCALRPRFLRR